MQDYRKLLVWQKAHKFVIAALFKSPKRIAKNENIAPYQNYMKLYVKSEYNMRARNLFILLVHLTGVIVLISPATFAQRVWYIDNSTIGSDERNGSSPTIPVPDDGITGPKKTLSGNPFGALASSNAGDTIYIAHTDTAYGTATGEQATIAVTKNLTFRSTDGAVTISSVFQVNNIFTSPNNMVIFDSGNFTLSGGLTLTSGVLNVGDSLIISDSSLITIDAGVLAKVGSGTVLYGNGISVQYVPSAADYVSSGPELPPTVKNLSFTRFGNTVNRVTTLVTPVTITDSLSIKNSLTTAATAPITLNGDLIIATDTFTNATQPSTSFGAALTLTGGANTKIIVPPTPATGIPLSALTIAKADSAKTVTLSGGNLDLSAGVVTFTKGIFKTDTNILYLTAPTVSAVSGGAHSQGYVGASTISHVVGNVAKKFVNNGTIAGSTEVTNVFPVGTGTIYRPVALTFNPASGVPTTPNATIVVSHVHSYPGGFQGLPIVNGVKTGVDIVRYPTFYWSIYTKGSVDQSTVFDIGLTAGNFTDFDDAGDVRIIRRHGAVIDVNNDWLLQGNNDNYDNEINSITGFSAINRTSVGGLRTSGAIFTYGLKTNIKPITCPMPDVIFRKVDGMYVPNPYKVPLADKFTNYVGTLTYLSSSTNPAVATVAIVQDTLLVIMLNNGIATIVIKATDSNNDFVTCTFVVEGGTTCCEDAVKVGIESPKEFSLDQNYPNPSNPTTNIMFSVPQSSSVKIAIYDMLGREIVTLVNADYMPGYYIVPFDGSKLASGTYMYRMTTQSLSGDHKNFTSTKKLILVK
jgi:hypothetical protein